ncbi:kinase-like domain-containing protein [Rhizophagus irregularis DAOM 181602=DAOM 197198]|nr:kinase-like domain-containing protein [Rhizophagus irregularis DAOM 181602=DAOM 197198]
MTLEGLYDNCTNCKRQRTAVLWCKNCDIAFLKENFRSWTSENPNIDEFIRHTQLNANEIQFIPQYGWKGPDGIWMKRPKFGLTMVPLRSS